MELEATLAFNLRRLETRFVMQGCSSEADLRLLDAHVAPPALRDVSHLGASSPAVPLRMLLQVVAVYSATVSDSHSHSAHADWRGFEPGPGPPLVHVPVPSVVATADIQQRGMCAQLGMPFHGGNLPAATQEQ
eukprot:651270-Amphidinium_carterae.1